MSKIIVITSHHKGEWDGGDSVITHGLQVLFPQLFRHELIYSEDVSCEDTDACVAGSSYLIHAGTPSWLTLRNRRFWKAAARHKKRVAMLGIGLAVPYSSEMWYGAEDFVTLRDTGLIDLIVCRDKFCYYWLHRRLGFPVDRITVLPCPGLFFAAVPSMATDKRVVFLSLANPEETAHETEYTFQGYFDRTAVLTAELRHSGADVRLVYQRHLSHTFRNYLSRYFGNHDVVSFASADEFRNFVTSSDVYIGVRNHGALPCSGAGKPSLLLGTDYRQYLADEVPFLHRVDISHVRWEPREILDWYHALDVESVAKSLVKFRLAAEQRWQKILRPVCEAIGG